MVLKADQEKVKALLTETVTILCRNGLQCNFEVNIEGLIGITIDKQDVFLVSIKDTILKEVSAAIPEYLDTSFTENPSETQTSYAEVSVTSKHTNLQSEDDTPTERQEHHNASVSSPTRTHPTGKTRKDSVDSSASPAKVKREYDSDSDESDEDPEELSLGLNPGDALRFGVPAVNPTRLAQQPFLMMPPRLQSLPYPTVPPLSVKLPSFTKTPPQRSKVKRQKTRSVELTQERQQFLLHRIMAVKGAYTTVRNIQRRNPSFTACDISHIMQESTKSPDDKLYVGEYKEVSHRTAIVKVFYKCPPQQITDEALEYLVTNRQAYTTLFGEQSKEFEGILQTDYKDSIERNSPYLNRTHNRGVGNEQLGEGEG